MNRMKVLANETEDTAVLGNGAYLAARVCLLSIALLSASVFSFYVDTTSLSHVKLIFTGIAFIFALHALSGLWLIRSKPGQKFSQFQLISDVLIVSALVYATGGPISPFLYLYLPLGVAAAVLLPRRRALAMNIVAATCCTLINWSLVFGWLAPLDGQPIRIPLIGLLVQTLGICSAMVLTAIGTSSFKKRLSTSSALVSQSRADLSALHERQQVLMDCIPEGVMTATSELTVLGLNDSARRLLGLDEASCVGRGVVEVLKDRGAEIAADTFDDHDHLEISISSPSFSQPRTLRLYRRELRELSSLSRGFVFVFQDVTKLRSAEDQLALQEHMARLIAESQDEGRSPNSDFGHFVGSSQIMQKVFRLIEKVAHSDATVLIHGESGTGKELAAKAIHELSEHKHAPFVPVNCGAIPETLIESELFGHKKGAFTGAENDHVGLFRRAEGGTIFLDEIGELPLHMQAKLLRALQEKTVRPVGADRDVPINVRIVAATNKNLKHEVAEGRFREDLFYRLNVIGINLPPLRDRIEDIPLLVHNLLKQSRPNKQPVVPPATMQYLMNYRYPGNVRELENILERALVLGGEVILPESLPDSVRTSDHSIDGKQPFTEILINENIEFPVRLDDILSTVERRYLETALLRTKGAKKKAAVLLGINFRSFRYRLQKFELSGSDDDSPEVSP